MTSPNDSRPPRLLDDAEVRRVLQRAVELEVAREGRITESQLIEVARDAGISVDAVQRALDEAPAAPRSNPIVRWWRRPVERQDRKHTQLLFQLSNAAAWIGFATVWSLVHGGSLTDFFEITGALGLTAAVLGGIVVTRREKTASQRKLRTAQA